MAAKIKFNPRLLMEKAIEVMKQSINEPRTDKKASPLVGAVLLKPDGTVDTAFRGELRHGDHQSSVVRPRLAGADSFGEQGIHRPGIQARRRGQGWEWLKNAIDLSGAEDVKMLALNDPDLEPLWTEISEI
jgi:hypothetical protein